MRVPAKLSLLLNLSLMCASGVFAQSASPPDSSPHKIQFVTVAPGVRLEVLDWGGTGTPIIFLAGSGDTAHVFDTFAPRFTAHHHVYGITRKASGASSRPAPANGNYTADGLANDVLAVMRALHINRPVLVGHSLAGEELSSIGSRYPEKISGLIYLDAAYGFAFYDPAHPALEIEMNDVKRRIDEIEAGGVDEQQKMRELEVAVARFETVLHQSNENVKSMPPLPPRSPIGAAINFGMEKFTSIPVPVLAIFACPHDWSRLDPQRRAARLTADKAWCSAQAEAFRRGVPTAHVVLIPNADHYVYRSNEAQVDRGDEEVPEHASQLAASRRLFHDAPRSGLHSINAVAVPRTLPSSPSRIPHDSAALAHRASFLFAGEHLLIFDIRLAQPHHPARTAIISGAPCAVPILQNVVHHRQHQGATARDRAILQHRLA